MVVYRFRYSSILVSFLSSENRHLEKNWLLFLWGKALKIFLVLEWSEASNTLLHHYNKTWFKCSPHGIHIWVSRSGKLHKF